MHDARVTVAEPGFPVDVEYIRMAWYVDRSRITTCLAVLNIFCSCVSVRVTHRGPYCWLRCAGY